MIVAPALAGQPGTPAAAASSPLRAAMVARENRAAALLTPTDARWLLAVQAAAQIQGGRAALLTPDRRHRLLRLSTRLGLRQFDANLVIAVVQDAARCGEPPLGSESASRLALVRPPAAPQADRDHWPAILMGLVLGAILLLVLIDSIAPG